MSLATAVVSILVFVALATSLWAATLGTLVIAGLVFAAKIYGRLHARHEELTAVFGLTQAIEGPLSVQEIVERVLQQSGRFLRVDSAEFLHYDGALKWRRGALHQNGSVDVTDFDPDRAKRITAALGHHVLHLDGEIPDPIAEWQGLSKIDRGVVSPLVSRGEVVGALILGNRPGPLSGFSKEDLSLLSTFSDHVAAKIDQALTEERLRLEVEEKHQIIRSKDQLIAAVSHELRTPLTGILGFAETLREQGSSLDPEIMSEAIASIANESTDLANIVDDLLTAARFELGALSAHTTPTDLAAIARRVIEALSTRVDLEIETELLPAVAEVDAPRVRQILRNLITNASRYGGDRIVVRTSRSNGTAKIEVSDNGVGIGDADPETIFAPYQSAHEPGTQPGSVGLGLTISRHLAQLMGGDLTFCRDEMWSVFSLAFEDNPGSSSADVEA
jgi:signal transduction histidine kinase